MAIALQVHGKANHDSQTHKAQVNEVISCHGAGALSRMRWTLDLCLRLRRDTPRGNGAPWTLMSVRVHRRGSSAILDRWAAEMSSGRITNASGASWTSAMMSL